MAKKHSTSGTGALRGAVATENEYSNSTFSRIYRAEVALEMALEIKEASERMQMYQLVKEGGAA